MQLRNLTKNIKTNKMKKEKIRIQVSGVRLSDKSIGALVDLRFNEKGINTSASRLVWFPKSCCELETIPSVDGLQHPAYFVNAPKWILDMNDIKTDK
jgi:hypothetical protein